MPTYRIQYNDLDVSVTAATQVKAIKTFMLERHMDFTLKAFRGCATVTKLKEATVLKSTCPVCQEAHPPSLFIDHVRQSHPMEPAKP